MSDWKKKKTMTENKKEGGESVRVRKRCNLKCTYKDGAQITPI